MWVRTRLLSRAFITKSSTSLTLKAILLLFALFHTDYVLTCTETHWELPSTLKTWFVHQHHCGMLQAIAALKFAQGATIDDNRFCSTCVISASTCIPSNSECQRHMWFLYSSFLQDSTAFSTAESCCSHLFCPSCCDGNLLVDTFCVQFFFI